MNAKVAAVAVLPLLLAACSTSVGKWTYPSGRYPTSTSPKPGAASVAVTPLLDLRSDVNKTYMIWYYIPLSAYGWTDFDRPEATIFGEDTTQYAVTPCDDLARSLVIELRRGNLVREATFSPDWRIPSTATHVLRGRLRSFSVAETRWSYGISSWSVILWGLGLPMGTSTNAFCADLELVDLKSDRVVWKDRIYDSDHHVEGYYYGPEWYRFSWMWERRLREKLGGLAEALGAQPAALPAALAEELRSAPPAKLPGVLGVDEFPPASEKERK